MHFLIGKVSVNICSTHRAFVDVLEALLTHTVVPTVQQLRNVKGGGKKGDEYTTTTAITKNINLQEKHPLAFHRP